jgi:hypothetical protein
MFILRMIDEGRIARNYELGDNYSVMSKFYNPKEFQDFCDLHQVMPELTDGIISDEDGKFFTLHKSTHYYVMTESGKTFERLHF